MGLFAFQHISFTQIVIGILQFSSAWLIVGYIWSVIWAILAFLKSVPERKLLNQENEPQTYNQSSVINPWEIPAS